MASEHYVQQAFPAHLVDQFDRELRDRLWRMGGNTTAPWHCLGEPFRVRRYTETRHGEDESTGASEFLKDAPPGARVCVWHIYSESMQFSTPIVLVSHELDGKHHWQDLLNLKMKCWAIESRRHLESRLIKQANELWPLEPAGAPEPAMAD